MSKQIIIIGGGISGLSVLHYLKKRYSSRDNFQVRLLEKSPHLGGTIQTLAESETLFETGPNGFLRTRDGVLSLIEELGLGDQTLPASGEAKIRYISCGNKLYKLPANPFEFLMFKPLTLLDKWKILQEPFVPKGYDRKESVYDFGKRRLGEKFSQIFLDAMVSGIYAGNAQTLHLASAFPRIFELEQQYGSLIKALVHVYRQKKSMKKNLTMGQPTGDLTSLNEGMGQLIKALARKYASCIRTNEKVLSIQSQGKGYAVETSHIKYFADMIFVCTPAYRSASLLKAVNNQLSGLLSEIPYAPVAVVGLAYKKEALKNLPRGFGYLIPSREKSSVLGVLFTSNIFANRCGIDEVFFRVMLGGARHPDVIRYSEPEITQLARDEIASKFAPSSGPVYTASKIWRSAIPQYNIEYPKIINQIHNIVKSDPHLHLVANYIGGISMNDCVKNAKLVVDNLTL